MSTGTASDVDPEECMDVETVEVDSGNESVETESSTQEGSHDSQEPEGAGSSKKGRRRKRGGKRGKEEQPPKVRTAANLRERTRMRVLSKAFVRLKTTLPWVPADTKLSKLDTLRLASSYIGHLSKVLQDDKVEDTAFHPVSLTWPFAINAKLQDPTSPDPEMGAFGPPQTVDSRTEVASVSS
ncbi:hypothetical protein Bbelb_264040 [Branchiostoma belcheri]|nr:hypothetical protein Bbelb_264040 [Branchiostoma belcheri]